jgi:hypothetical protein
MSTTQGLDRGGLLTNSTCQLCARVLEYASYYFKELPDRLSYGHIFISSWPNLVESAITCSTCAQIAVWFAPPSVDWGFQGDMGMDEEEIHGFWDSTSVFSLDYSGFSVSTWSMSYLLMLTIALFSEDIDH